MQPLKYQLLIRQQPIQGRTSNLRDGRTMEPPPVLELVVSDSTGKKIRDFSNIPYQRLIANALLVVPEKMKTEISILDLLDGSKTVECQKLIDPENGSESLFFVFPHLFCRGKGVFFLKISLFELPTMHNHGKSVSLDTVETNIFTIHSPKEYPGRLAVSNLSLSFLQQGVNIPCANVKKNHVHQDDIDDSRTEGTEGVEIFEDGSSVT